MLLCNLARHAADHAPAAFRAIADELAQLVACEERERLAVERDGVRTAVHLPNEADPRYECVRCRQICYLSAVICRCAAGARRQVACLRHHRHLCECAPTSKVLVMWYKMEDLRLLAGGVKEKAAVSLAAAVAAAAAATAAAAAVVAAPPA